MPKPNLARRRLVRLFITDPGTDIAVEEATVFASAEFPTDDTDSELFIGLDIPAQVAVHNEKRKALNLEPVKVRDLTFTVATLVYF